MKRTIVHRGETYTYLALFRAGRPLPFRSWVIGWQSWIMQSPAFWYFTTIDEAAAMFLRAFGGRETPRPRGPLGVSKGSACR